MSKPPPSRVPASSPGNAPGTSAEQRAQAHLAEGRWRKARDELKPLVKADRARFLPLLVEANEGLAREMIRKGLLAEAEQVLAYLATIAAPARLRGLRLEWACAQGATGAALPDLLQALADPGSELSPSVRARFADTLVLAGSAVRVGPGEGALAGELEAVHRGLQAVAASRWDEVADAVRGIAHRSPFGAWAWYLKGLAAFYRGDAERAARCFGELSPETVPARAARAYEVLLGKQALPILPTPGREALLGAVCALAGERALGRVLFLTDRTWREKGREAAYGVLRQGVQGFPSQRLDGPGMLSRFFWSRPLGLSEGDAEELVDWLWELLDRREVGNAAEDLEVLESRRLLCLVDKDCLSQAERWRMWHHYLADRERLKGCNPRFMSQALTWLGAQLAEGQRIDRRNPYGGFDTEPLPSQAIQEVLQRSIELDPSNLPAYLLLCQEYDELGLKQPRNRLLDEMTARFPHQKPVLVAAAIGCIDRAAFHKGLAYVEQARRLDPLDPQLPELEVATRQRMAEQYYRQGKLSRARQLLEQTEALLTERSDDIERGRWSAVIRRAVMEELWGEPEVAQSWLDNGCATAPRPEAALLLAHLVYRAIGGELTEGSPYLKRFQQELRQEPTVARVNRLLRMLQRMQQQTGEWIAGGLDRPLGAALQDARKRPFIAAEVLETFELSRAFMDDALPLGALLEQGLREDPKHPALRLLKLDREDDGPRPEEVVHRELEAILDEAVQRRDERTLRQVRERMRRSRRPIPSGGPADPEAWDEGPDDAADWPPPDPEDFDDGPGPLGGLSRAEQAKLLEMIMRLAVAPEEVVRHARSRLPKGLSPELFDTLLRSARQMAQAAGSGKAKPPPGPGRSPPPVPKPAAAAGAPPRGGPSPPEPPGGAPDPTATPPRDPNQLELF